MIIIKCIYIILFTDFTFWHLFAILRIDICTYCVIQSQEEYYNRVTHGDVYCQFDKVIFTHNAFVKIRYFHLKYINHTSPTHCIDRGLRYKCKRLIFGTLEWKCDIGFPRFSRLNFMHTNCYIHREIFTYIEIKS